jgi:hypothetical protein
MSHLLDLAPEPFAGIISLLDTNQWTSLWLCGDSRMIWRLSKGRAVREVAFEWCRYSACSWRSHVHQLDGLESFSLTRPRISTIGCLTGLHLTSLSRNLKKLELSGVLSLDALNELDSKSPGHFLHLETLHISGCIDIGCLKFQIPETVTDLKLFPSKAPFGELSLSTLPRNLIRLWCRADDLKTAGSRFPESLRSIKIGIIQTLEIFHLVPLDIEEIILERGSSILCPTLDDWTAISRLTYLKRLSFEVGGFLQREHAELIPRSVEDLYLKNAWGFTTSARTVEFMQALPKNLKKLGGVWPSRDIVQEVAQNMPRTLEVAYDSRIIPDGIAKLPDKFTRLEIPITADLLLVSSFPSNLRFLKVANLPIALLKLLPDGLETLESSNTRLVITTELAKALPKGLTSLEIKSAFNPIPSDCDLELLFEALPPRLTSLISSADPVQSRAEKIVCSSTTAKSSLLLPRSLYKIHIGYLDFVDDQAAEWILGLPTRLTSLEIMVLRLQNGMLSSFASLAQLENLAVHVANAPEGGWAHHVNFGKLPRKLQKLRLMDSQNDKTKNSLLANESLKGSPKYLTDLFLPDSPFLTEKCLVHLPNVEWLCFGPFRVPDWFSKARK